ncbi:HK97 family phage prohead protease [Bifidobacterium sp. ESL0790]|uniref:HK97 family phage prohead protease n=1 Tax=Bifidobacterium sp. ESL0790 TaxID=2983233 RepID=UPI0023F9D1F8|nr:HK97 family phage prohead protease [Bifidobacterium sp. ESL0790]WEV72144.1 HK97 family phage prohead protease [Bifidobacterium sp. ESL0790]
MAKITVVTGPPAAGKTTYIAEHKHDGDVVVDFDALAKALGQTAEHSVDGVPASLARTARDNVIDDLLKGVDTDSWIIQTWMNPSRSNAYEQAKAEIVTVDPGIDEVLRHAKDDGRDDATMDEIRRWYDHGGSLEKRKSGTQTKICKRFAVKADASAGEGKFTALVSAFGVKDSQGQIIEPGAFAESLKGFDEKTPLPIIWDHQWDDIWSHIGSAQASETDEGLQVEAQLDMDNPTAQQAYSLLSQGRVHEFSIGGFEDRSQIETDDDGTEHVKQFDLAEVSMTLKGANPDTRLIDVKHHESEHVDKEGRVLAAKHVEALKSTRASLAEDIKALDDVIDAVSPPGDSGKSKNLASEHSEAFLMRRRKALARIHLAALTGEEEK